MYVYKTTNTVNNKIYIGQSIRNDDSYIGSGREIKKAIDKFGKENFKKEIIEECNNRKHLNEREMYWISYYNSLNPNVGYNVDRGGSNEISDAIKNSCNKPEELKRKSKTSKELWSNEDYRKKVTESNNKTWSDPKKREEHSKRMKERMEDPIYRKNLSEAAKNMKKVYCPHCGKGPMVLNAAKRWHFDNCKHLTIC